MKQFSIQFANLKSGTYDFEFAINEKFFENFEESEITHGKLKTTIELQREARMLILNFDIKGIVKLTCDRCLDDFDQKIETKNQLIFKFGSETKEETDEIIIIPESDNTLYIAQYIYEFIHLALPTKRIHPKDKNGKSLCNKEILKKLEQHKAIEDSKEEEIDPRWEGLKNIKFN